MAISVSSSTPSWSSSSGSAAPSLHALFRDLKALLETQPGRDPSQAIVTFLQVLASVQQAQGNPDGASSVDPRSSAAEDSSAASADPAAQLVQELQQLLAQLQARGVLSPSSQSSDSPSTAQPPVAGIGHHHPQGGHKLKAVAAALQETPQALQAQLQSGQSLGQIAQAKGITDLASAVAANMVNGRISFSDQQKRSLANAWLEDVQRSVPQPSAT